MNSSFCGFRTAFQLDDRHGNLDTAWSNLALFDIAAKGKYPNGWKFDGTEGNPSGPIIIFLIEDHIPTSEELDIVEKEVQRLNDSQTPQSVNPRGHPELDYDG